MLYLPLMKLLLNSIGLLAAERMDKFISYLINSKIYKDIIPNQISKEIFLYLKVKIHKHQRIWLLLFATTAIQLSRRINLKSTHFNVAVLVHLFALTVVKHFKVMNIKSILVA